MHHNSTFLTKVRTILDQGWGQGHLYNAEDGTYCLMGGIAAADGRTRKKVYLDDETHRMVTAQRYIVRAIKRRAPFWYFFTTVLFHEGSRFSLVTSFNDHHRKVTVMRVVDTAIALAMKDEAAEIKAKVATSKTAPKEKVNA